MTPAEVEAFEADPLYQDSLLIRKYDEMAKIPGMEIKVSWSLLRS